METTKSKQKGSRSTSNAAQEEKTSWAYCPVCHGIGEEGRECSNCIDMGMIYNVPIEDYELPNFKTMRIQTPRYRIIQRESRT